MIFTIIIPIVNSLFFTIHYSQFIIYIVLVYFKRKQRTRVQNWTLDALLLIQQYQATADSLFTNHLITILASLS